MVSGFDLLDRVRVCPCTRVRVRVCAPICYHATHPFTPAYANVCPLTRSSLTTNQPTVKTTQSFRSIFLSLLYFVKVTVYRERPGLFPKAAFFFQRQVQNIDRSLCSGIRFRSGIRVRIVSLVRQNRFPHPSESFRSYVRICAFPVRLCACAPVRIRSLSLAPAHAG